VDWRCVRALPAADEPGRLQCVLMNHLLRATAQQRAVEVTLMLHALAFDGEAMRSISGMGIMVVASRRGGRCRRQPSVAAAGYARGRRHSVLSVSTVWCVE